MTPEVISKRQAKSAFRLCTALLIKTLGVLSCVGITGCGAADVLAVGFSGASIQGFVQGGLHPVSGAAVQLYAVGVSSDGSAATPLLRQAVQTDSNGNFSISDAYTCPSPASMVYLVSSGGNPGLAVGTNNAAATMMTALGTCSGLAMSPQVAIDEVTTVASVWPLAPFMNSYKATGAAPADNQQLTDAFGMVDQLANITNGTAPGPLITPGYAAPVDQINSIANILSTCIVSPGGSAGDGSVCGNLFAKTRPAGGPPVTETVGAALQMVKNPESNVSGLFNLASANPPFQPDLISAPESWMVALAPAGSASTAQHPSSSSFTPPPANQCQSHYDQYYETEPGVFAFWALCETGNPIQIHDYVGTFDLTSTNGSFGLPIISTGIKGPVPDGENADKVSTALYSIENQGILLNSNQGTISAWINADATPYPVTALYLAAVGGSSAVSLSVNSSGNRLCFNGNFTNSTGSPYQAQNCGYTEHKWHRVAFTWSGGTLNLYVDGVSAASGVSTGSLDNKLFFYRLFPGCCDTSKQMTLAKVLVANQAWSSDQANLDFAPNFPNMPSGGLYVSTQQLGTIHKDVLGYADNNQDISSPALTSALQTGIAAGGFSSLRYAGGYGGKNADIANWQGGVTCASWLGGTSPAQNIATANNLDNYMQNVAKPAGMDVVYTVNYGSNPPYCNAGGDPVTNGANLVQYANINKGYGIKYWEIGNEQYAAGSETDFHANPSTGASYSTYEPAFYNAMKSVDPTIKIGVPVALGIYSWATNFSLPVMASASYDAIVWHDYAIVDPITDGDTLYGDRVASNTNRTRAALLTMQTALMNNGKSPDSIWVTEWDDEQSGNLWSKQTMGAVIPLFAANELAQFMMAGVQTATWWEQGTADVCTGLNYDNNGDGAYSWWECGDTAPMYTGPVKNLAEVTVGLQAGSLTPAGRAFQLLSQSGFVTEGEHMLSTQLDVQNAPWLRGYAATHGSSYALILINRDRDNPHTVPVNFAGKTSGGSAQQWTYGRAQYDQTQYSNWAADPVVTTLGSWSNTLQVTLPAWSVSVVVLGN